MIIEVSRTKNEEPNFLYLDEYCDKYSLKIKIDIIVNKYHNHSKYVVYLVYIGSCDKVYIGNLYKEKEDLFGISFNCVQDAVLSLIGRISLKDEDKNIYLGDKILDFSNIRTDLSYTLREQLNDIN